MKHLATSVCLFALLLSSCTATRETNRQARNKALVEKLTLKIWNEDPATPDSISGYLPNPEVNLRDALIRKFPLTPKKEAAPRVDTFYRPAQKIYIQLPGRVDTVFNHAERDSLLSQFAQMAMKQKENSELQEAFAALQVRLNRFMDSRGCLSDTLVRLRGFGYAFTVHVVPKPNGKYEFQLVQAERAAAVGTKPVSPPPPPRLPEPATLFYLDEWFWAFAISILVGGSYAWWITLRLQTSKPTALK